MTKEIMLVNGKIRTSSIAWLNLVYARIQELKSSDGAVQEGKMQHMKLSHHIEPDIMIIDEGPMVDWHDVRIKEMGAYQLLAPHKHKGEIHKFQHPNKGGKKWSKKKHSRKRK